MCSHSTAGRGRRLVGPFGRRVWALAASVLFAAGCAGGPGSPYSMFNPTHRLLDSAKAMRDAAPVPAAVPRELDKRPQPPFTLEPGDVVLVQPADVESPVHIPGDQPVMPDGTIELGKYGRLQVAGKTVEEVETAARSLVEVQAKDVGVVTVRVVTRASKVYYVLGEVNAPGAYQLAGRETVLDALMAAGGLTDRASRDSIILDRPTPPDSCRVVLPVCWSEIVQLGDTSTNYQITAGDRIYVPSRTFCEEFLHMQPKCPCNRPQTACPIPVAAPGPSCPAAEPAPAPQSAAPWSAAEPAPPAVPALPAVPAPPQP